jgi:hypothetical protein
MSGDASRLRISRDRLIFMGLAVLDQIAEECHREPHRRGVALRVTMAMLYAFSDGRRGPYDQFWRMCAEPNQARDPQRSALQRGQTVRDAFHGICRTLNVRETGALRAQLRQALTDPGRDMRGYSVPSGPMTEDDMLRMRMADLDRVRAHGHDADLARERRGKECPIRD